MRTDTLDGSSGSHHERSPRVPAATQSTLAVSPIVPTAELPSLPPPPPLSLPLAMPFSPLTASRSARTDSTCGAPDEAASEYQRKRTERMFSCENMREDVDRDLRITGVTKKGSSWQYHINVLDTRARLPSFMDPGSLSVSASTLSPAADASPRVPGAGPTNDASSVPSDDATYAALPPIVRYSVMRRYNDFRQLYVYLVDTYGAEVLDALPKFPDGGLLSYIRGDDPRLLQFRKEQLERFLRALDAHPQLHWCSGLTHFLRPDLLELTTIGGMFQTHAEDAAAANHDGVFGHYASSNNGGAAQPPTSSSGYVSLSLIKSPEIRFGKHASDGRGDRKRRRVPFGLWSTSASGRTSDVETPVAAPVDETQSASIKRVSLTEEEEDDSEDGASEPAATTAQTHARSDPSDLDSASEQLPSTAPTRLMKLLSLDPALPQ